MKNKFIRCWMLGAIFKMCVLFCLLEITMCHVVMMKVHKSTKKLSDHLNKVKVGNII